MTTRPPWWDAVQARLRALEAQPLPPSIPALLREAASDVPDRIALSFIATGEDIAYADLLDRVRRVARGLHEAGVRHGTKVAVMLPNIPQMPVTWLALSWLGAVMVPVNIRYTATELDYVLSDSGASFLVLHADFAGLVAETPSAAAMQGRVFVVGGDAGAHRAWDELAARDGAGFAPEREPVLDDLLNIQYTSGTTGFPKGCLLTQRYWLTCAKSYADCDGLRFRNLLASNPYFYMTPQWLTLSAWFHRGTLHVAPYRSLTQFMGWVRDRGVEFCLFPQEVHTTQPPRPEDAENAMQRGNLYLHRADLHAEVQSRFGFPLRTAFGMTEIGMGLFTPLEAEEMTGSGSCGLPGPWREARIADLQGNTLPHGESGELLIRGPGLLRGYHNKPEATAAAFHGDWFRTGDLARQDANGFVWIIGRIKDMVRRAGENIAAAEVESVLNAIQGVAESCVVPVPDALRGEEVKAYLRLAEGVTPRDVPPEAVIAHCRRHLAPFKVPRYLAYRDADFPRSPGGTKVRKPALIAESADLTEGAWDRTLNGG
jgi:crotonobetaine/carnitine-CoA ligase